MEQFTTKDMQQEFENIKDNLFNYNQWGLMLDADYCDGFLEIKMRAGEQKMEYHFAAENIYTLVLLQYKVLDIMSKNKDNIESFAITKSSGDLESEEKGQDYSVNLSSYSSDLHACLKGLIASSNKLAIQNIKQSVKENKEREEAQDTIMYFLQKSKTPAIKEFEKFL